MECDCPAVCPTPDNSKLGAQAPFIIYSDRMIILDDTALTGGDWDENKRAGWSKKDMAFLKRIAKRHLKQPAKIRWTPRFNVSPQNTKILNVYLSSSMRTGVPLEDRNVQYIPIREKKDPKQGIRLKGDVRTTLLHVPEHTTPNICTNGKFIYFMCDESLKTVCIPACIGLNHRKDKFGKEEQKALEYIFKEIKPFLKRNEVIKREINKRRKESMVAIKKLSFVDNITVQKTKTTQRTRLTPNGMELQTIKERCNDLVITTKELEATLPTKTKKTEVLGKFKITINLDKNFVSDIKNLDKHPSFIFDHPNIEAGMACLGGYEKLLNNQFRQGNYVSVITIVKKMLTKLSGEDEFVAYPKFFKMFKNPPLVTAREFGIEPMNLYDLRPGEFDRIRRILEKEGIIRSREPVARFSMTETGPSMTMGEALGFDSSDDD